ncbi:MAG: Stress responsive alpha-beta barrel protein [Spirosoma sp.]|nr:Stress responsive alpha-beta barrel protein [Spirosoma sp.]
MRTLLILCLCTWLLWACYPKGFRSNSSAGLPQEATIQRIVCFKFKPGTTPLAIQQHMQGFASLKDSIPYILSYQAGATVLADLSQPPEYDVMHYCTYRNEEEIKRYSIHPVHQRFITQNKKIWEKVLVINSRLRP